jgi:hypothetical protein
MSNLVLIHLETVLVSVQERCTVCAKCTIGSKSFWTHPMVLLVGRLKSKLVLVRLEIVLILTQDRSTVWAKHTTGSEMILDAPNGTPR